MDAVGHSRLETIRGLIAATIADPVPAGGARAAAESSPAGHFGPRADHPSGAIDLVDIDLSLRAQSDDELLASAGNLEAIGRAIDAARVAVAAEVAARSRSSLGGDRLCVRKGCRTANELLQRVTGASGATVQRRIALGDLTRGETTLTGELLPAPFEHVARALHSGELGLDAARSIATVLAPVSSVAGVSAVGAAEAELVEAAIGAGAIDPARATADEVRVQASVWAQFLDPDGAEPAHDRMMARRMFRLGAETGGLVTISGALMPEAAATLRCVMDAYLSPRNASRFIATDERVAAHGEAKENGDGSGERDDEAEAVDPRSLDQQRHDVFVSLVAAAARAEDAPLIAGASPAVLVTVRASDLAERRGSGFIDGSDASLPVTTIEHLACANGSQQVVLDDAGRIVSLGSVQRCFNPTQRRAITARDGGCVIPGCQVPASWCEIHHVVPAAAGGPTHTDNGALLCWFHHRTIDTSGWKIRMNHGSPHVKPPPWLHHDPRWRPSSRSRTRRLDALARRRA